MRVRYFSFRGYISRQRNDRRKNHDDPLRLQHKGAPKLRRKLHICYELPGRFLDLNFGQGTGEREFETLPSPVDSSLVRHRASYERWSGTSCPQRGILTGQENCVSVSLQDDELYLSHDLC